MKRPERKLKVFNTKDIDHNFFIQLVGIASRLHAIPADILSVMMAESGVRANAHNPNGHASGLIQFMPNTLVNLGWIGGHVNFRALLSATEQLLFVEKYYKPYIGNLDSIAGLYVATFLPALINHYKDRNFVLSAKSGIRGWAFAPNASFDANGDLQITVGELEQAVRRNCVGPRWSELLARLSGEGIVDIPSDSTDLTTTFGIQTKLVSLGYNLGLIDGIPGSKTRAAVCVFQTDHNLANDGIVGPLTLHALQEAT